MSALAPALLRVVEALPPAPRAISQTSIPTWTPSRLLRSLVAMAPQSPAPTTKIRSNPGDTGDLGTAWRQGEGVS